MKVAAALWHSSEKSSEGSMGENRWPMFGDQRNKEPGRKQVMQFYDAIKNWRRIKPHLSDVEFNRILIEDFNKYTYGRWREPFPAEGRPYPRSFESCDWGWEHRGREPGYWRYVKHSACHWLVNSNLRLATLVLPDRQWRIVTSQRHSTVWDGDHALFDFNGQALFKNADEAFELASAQQLKPGRYMTTHFAEHYQIEIERHRRGVGEGLCSQNTP
jgi:hypothetical protein